ncbi:MAG: FKBP-type peptidyl-prolyl cis-trans isomerase, partial [Nanoarchaeota archaeon]|nr:FKBP-type peptidyl-prolyl cis-trans isomerase [Nanoarchaeota archaeon]
MTKIKKGDFVQVEYTGKLEDGMVFDTTSKKAAEQSGSLNEKAKYGPVIICIGQHHILKAIDDSIEGKEVGESFS